MTLKQLFAGAAALAALTTVAQAADMRPVLKAPAAEPQQQASGYVEVYTGWASTVVDLTQCYRGEGCDAWSAFDESGWVLGGAGRGNYWISPGMSLQVDVQAEGTSYGDNGDRRSVHSYLIGGHLSWRNPQQSLYGVFVGAGDANSTRHGVIGAEAQWYWGQFTLYGQVGYDSTIDSGYVDVSAWFLRATGRYFVNPNFMIEATGMYANGDVDFGGDSRGFDTWIWQAKAEWRLATAPISLFAKYQGSQTNYDTLVNGPWSFDAKSKDHRVMFGLKLNMGDRNLQATDRAGATLDIISPLANPSGPLMFVPPGNAL